MITFSERQLKIPKMSKPVYLVTGGMSKFGRAIPEKRTEELVIDAFKEAAEFKGTSIVEILANCVIFQNKIHSLITSKETKEENQLVLEAGQPMLFGKDMQKGIVLKGTQLKAVELGKNGVTIDDILVHHPNTLDPGIHMMLASMAPPELPAAMGVIRAVKTPTLEGQVWKSIEQEKESSPFNSVDDLLNSGNTWEID